MSDAQTILKGAYLVLRTVSGPGGRNVVYGAQCTTCRETSGQGSDVARSVGAWAVGHTRTHPEHRGYVSITRTRWRVDPYPDPPRSDTAPVGNEPGQPVPTGQGYDRLPQRPAHHARPLPAWRLALPAAVWGAGVRLRDVWSWIRTWVLPIAGPLFLASISAALGFFVGAFSVLVTG